jgi:CheY-like chemotaxis protein
VVDEREVGLALGAVDYFVKPIERGALLSMLERHGVAKELPEQPAILVIDTDPERLAGLERWLRECGYRVSPALSAAQALATTREQRFDLIVFENGLAGPDDEPMLDALREEPSAATIPVVVLTSGEITADDWHLAILIGSDSPVLGVISREDLSPEHLRRWLGEAPVAAAPAADEPVLA